MSNSWAIILNFKFHKVVLIQSFHENLSVKKIKKSVYTHTSYDQKKGVPTETVYITNLLLCRKC